MTSEISISVTQKESDRERCGYCLDGLYDEETWVCDACDTALHLECYKELQTCVTMGCINKAIPSEDIQARLIRRARRRRGPPAMNPARVRSRWASRAKLFLLMLLLIIFVPIACTCLLITLASIVTLFWTANAMDEMFSIMLSGVLTVFFLGASYLLIKVFRKTLQELNET